MTPEKAMELVGRYARLTRQIKDCSARIVASLALCEGMSGQRSDPYRPCDYDDKGRDRDVHLWNWYQPETVDDGTMSPCLVWHSPGEDEADECQHCYAAHVAIQERKLARRQLGAVRGAMSRATA